MTQKNSVKSKAEALHRLIHSLSASEKNYVSSFLKFRKIKNNSKTIILYQAFIKAEVYDKKVIMELADIALETQYRNQKSYLQSRVLDALFVLDSENNNSAVRLKYLIQIKLLMNKKMYEEALVLCSKLSEETELDILSYTFLMRLKELEIEALNLLYFDNWNSDLFQRMSAIHNEQKKIAELNRIMLIYQEVRIYSGETVSNKNFIELSAEEKKKMQEQLTLLVKERENCRQYLNMQRNLSLLIINLSHQLHLNEEVFNESSNLVQITDLILEKNPRLTGTTGFCASYVNFMLLKIHHGLDTSMEAVKIKTFRSKYGTYFNLSDSHKMDVLEHLCDLNIFIEKIANGSTSELNQIIAKELDAPYQNRIQNKSFDSKHEYLLAYSFFITGDFKNCKKYTNDILTNYENMFYESLSAARILEVIINYELGEEEVVVYLIQRFQRFQKNNNFHSTIHIKFISLINKVIKMEPKERIELFREFTESFEVLKNSNSKPIVEYFDVETWILSKISNVSFAEASKNNLTRKLGRFSPF